jgi:hypothetical protein
VPDKQKLTKAFLQKVYITDRLSTWTIEKEYGYSRCTVYSSLKKFGIPTRSIAESHVSYPRKNFSGNKVEQSYLIGFAIGDLRVRNHNKIKSETISIACGSTKQAQIDLIYSLFSQYGRVWVGKPDKRGAINIEAYVNTSFAFLLPDQRSYTWCGKKSSTFLAFLAGFTDAEGSFFITNNQARIAWGNYDNDILLFIKEQLGSLHITSSNIHTDKLQGHVGSHGYARNKNYHHLAITQKVMVSELLKQLKPYLKHQDKLKRLAVLEKNIKLRNTKSV